MRVSSWYAEENQNSCVESKERKGIWDVEAQKMGSIYILKSVSSVCKKNDENKWILSLLLEVSCLSNEAASIVFRCIKSGFKNTHTIANVVLQSVFLILKL